MTRRDVLGALTLGGMALAMAASAPAPARAQVAVGGYGAVGYGGYGGYGYNGYGLGAYGGGYGYSGGYGYGGPFGGMGTTLADQETYKQQSYALNASRYDLQTAQAAQAYSQANYYKQQSIGAALANQKKATALRESYSTKTAAPKFSTQAAPARPTVPLTRLVSPINGAVQWPAVAPQNPAQASAAARVAEVSSQYRKEGQATVQSVGEAREAIYAYGRPALEAVRKSHPSQAAAFKDFLNNLDLALNVMAQPPAPVKIKK